MSWKDTQTSLLFNDFERKYIDMINVIVPSAKIVPQELQTIGKLPPVIYPLNDRIVFDYIYDQYSKTADSISVLCFEKSDKVRKRLAEFNTKKTRIVDIPKLGDLGLTIYFGLDSMEDTVIINFSDTIVLDDIQKIEGDCFFQSYDEVSDKWTFFDEDEGVITEIYDKIQKKMVGEKPLFVGVFKLTDAKLFRYCLQEAFLQDNLSMSTFYFALMLYSRKKPLKAVSTSNWFDIGHLDRYYDTQIEVKSRAFNHITIDKDRGLLKKTSDEKEKFIGEVLWYVKLPADIEYVRPRIFSYSTDYNAPYVTMEYYSYHTLHELFLYGDLSCSQWKDIFMRIRFVCNDFKRYTVKSTAIRASLEDMYLTKTLNRLYRMRADKRFEAFFVNNICVNGIAYCSLDSICQKLKESIPLMLYDVDSFSIIHGDLCFSNILVDSNLSFIKVIDPRGKFGCFDIYGDTRYELAKLFHSVDGKYDFLIKDLFDIEFDVRRCRIDYKVKDRARDYDLYQLCLKVFQEEIGIDLKKIELIEALLFLSMIPLHGESEKHQMAMLATGLEILNRVVNIEL